MGTFKAQQQIDFTVPPKQIKKLRENNTNETS